MNYNHYHLMYHPPTSNWPNGCWALYRITGDEIAQRVRFNDDGEVTRRESWPGYVGTFATLAEAVSLIEPADKVAKTVVEV